MTTKYFLLILSKILKRHFDFMKLEDQPGENYNYTSGNTQLLGAILEATLKDKTISQ